MLIFKRSLSAALILFLLVACSSLKESKPSAHFAAIASAHPLATQAGMDILAQGGNAFDAAVAVAASLSVVEPYSAGLGGGGFWLLYEAKTNRYRFIDARETAPSRFHRDYYLTEQGQVDRDKAMNGPTASGIPGIPAALAFINSDLGTLPLAQVLAPAVAQAEQGVAVDEFYRLRMSFRKSTIERYPASARIFLEDNDIPQLGFVLKQSDLANTLKRLGEGGHAGFYQGTTAQLMLAAVNNAGGEWTQADLESYQVKEREPVRKVIGDKEIISAPPPSSGGIALLQMLEMLEQFPWQSMSKTEQTHLLAEVMRRAYRDRAEYLGDPDYVTVPTERLLSSAHNRAWAQSIRLEQATSSLSLHGSKNSTQGPHTTHFVVLDSQGNMVSTTMSINLPFGSAFVAEGTGVLLNDQMDDFSTKPGEPNAYGLVGNEANAIAAGKRPLSSMTPTIINSPTETALLGTPGGSRIISMVLLGVLEYWQGKPVEEWVARPRVHHQYLPDLIEYEPNALTEQEVKVLEAKGHRLKNTERPYGNMQAIFWQKQSNKVTAASDPRVGGVAQVSQ
ncbi:MAG: gamma-glutamyltransferase [Venatoribacter sp.]